MAGDRQEISNFIEIEQMSIKKCNEITMIAAKMQNDKDIPKCDDGSNRLSGCASDYCIALEVEETKFVKIVDLLRASMMTTTSADCIEDLCVAKCQELSLIAARSE